MTMGIGDEVRLKPGAKGRDLLRELGERTGTVGDVWTHEGVVRLNVLYGERGPLAVGVPAADFERVADMDGERG